MFLQQMGTTSFAIAIFGLSACTSSRDSTDSPDTEPPASTSPTPTPAESSAESQIEPAMTYQRVNLGFVSAYILIRADVAAIVDTGVAGSEPDIEAGLAAAGLGWGNVEHLILTHRHADHVGSVEAVLAGAGSAATYAGEADIAQIAAPQPIAAVGDGDEVFGLQIINTPGHTDGHISVLDPIGGVLVAGDALNGADGGVVGANPQFSTDMTIADESVRKLAALSFDTILFGHGEPVEGGARLLMKELAAGL
jgi:glyoxylase-like metal-dependent hydrolase (beta-lactamase superfamily II)